MICGIFRYNFESRHSKDDSGQMVYSNWCSDKKKNRLQVMARHDPLVEKLTFLVSQIAIGKIVYLYQLVDGK